MQKTYSIEETKKVANQIRKEILGVALRTGGCYLAQACSSAEIVASLYTQLMNLGPSVANWEPIPFPGVPGPDNMDYQRGANYNGDIKDPNNDRLFVSCCHYASVIYSALAATGRICPDCMDKFNVDGWNMEMIGAEHSPGFENTAGSLGQTISIAAGTAHAYKMKGYSGNMWAMLGDGELAEGQTWECIQAAAHYKLDNFYVIIDCNGQQVEGAIEDQMTLEPLKTRFESFGCACVEVDGHDVSALIEAKNTPHKDKPLVIICRTKGTTGCPPLEKKWPFLHFVRISEAEKPEFTAIYESL